MKYLFPLIVFVASFTAVAVSAHQRKQFVFTEAQKQMNRLDDFCKEQCVAIGYDTGAYVSSQLGCQCSDFFPVDEIQNKKLARNGNTGA